MSTVPPLSRRDVAVVPWPAEAGIRERLALLRVPRVLLVPADLEPPALLDDLEDWVREGIHPDDLAIRTRWLAQRAEEAVPAVDDDGLLHYAGHWIALPLNQVDLVRLLVERLGRIVPKDVLTEAYVRAGGSGHPNSIRSVTVRLAKRLQAVGLDLVSIRGRGVMLVARRPGAVV